MLGPARVSALWLAVPVLGFIALLVYHQRIRNRRTQARRAADFYQAGLDRLNDQWSGKGTSGARFDVPHHIYGDDLDLFGTDSLYELLCAARTQLGENILAQWLLAPAALSVIRARQASIVDLRARLDFRESMAIDGESLKIDLHPDVLDAWARAPNRLERAVDTLDGAAARRDCGRHHRRLGRLGPVVSASRGHPRRGGDWLFPEEAHSRGHHDGRERVRRFEGSVGPAQAHRSAALRGARRCVDLQRKLSSHSLNASAALAKLATIVNFVEARRNPILAPFLLLLMYPLQTALAAERWRSIHGAVIRSWLEVLGEFEALLSLAQYSYEQPADPFPEFLDGAPAFQGDGTGPSLDPRRGTRLQRCRHRGRDARIAGERLEYVGQEHAVAHDRHQYRAGNGRSAGARRSRCS